MLMYWQAGPDSYRDKHIVNFTRIKGYNAVNMKSGYNLLEIRNPKDLIEYGNEEN